MKSKIITILLLLIIAFSIVTLSGCWLLNNNSNSDGDSSLDTDGSSSSTPAAKELLVTTLFEDKLYTNDEEITIEVKLGTLYGRNDIEDFYKVIDTPMDESMYSKLYMVLDSEAYSYLPWEFFERIKESKLTVVYTVEDFCGENYPIVSNGYTIKNEDLNSVIVNIPKTLFVDNIGRIGIRTLFCGYGSGFYIYYKHQDNGIFISRKYIKGALDNEE